LPLGDSEAAFQCVKWIAENRKLARAKRSAARAQAERFSWQQVAAQITAGYQRLCRRKFREIADHSFWCQRLKADQLRDLQPETVSLVAIYWQSRTFKHARE
jgi:hypothetical protein